MIVTAIDVSLEIPPSKTPRSPGVHLSSIIRCIATEQGILKPEWAEELSLVDVRTITDPVAILRICIGLAWEEWYIPNVLRPQMGVVDHPGELEVDGIYMTPDGESVSVIITLVENWFSVVHEVKSTYKSIKTVGNLTEQWMWLAQIMSYCRAMKTTHAVLHALFLCGDYTWPQRPQRRQWSIEFTQEELDQNWGLMTDYRDMKMGEPNE